MFALVLLGRLLVRRGNPKRLIAKLTQTILQNLAHLHLGGDRPQINLQQTAEFPNLNLATNREKPNLFAPFTNIPGKYPGG